MPGFDNSAMDGFAIRAADSDGAGEAPRSLRVVDESRAGHPARATVAPGEAISISTGAMVPGGADAVIRVEDTDRDGDRVTVSAAVPVGSSIRRGGEDMAAGSLILGPGGRIGAAELGALAAGGVPEIACARRPRVSVLLTGDELVEPDRRAAPGADPRLERLCGPAARHRRRSRVGSGRGDRRRPRDDARGDRARHWQGDVLVVCGGVSVGEHDHVRPALESLGVEQVFWGVSLRPGKPTYFGVAPSGRSSSGCPVIRSRPWSPSPSSFARRCSPCRGPTPHARSLVARLTEAYTKVRGRAEAIRVERRGGGVGLGDHPDRPAGLPRADVDARRRRPGVRRRRPGGSGGRHSAPVELLR